MAGDQEFTFKDWKDGKLEQVYYDRFLGHDSSGYSFLEYLKTEGELSQREYKKIEEAKKRASDLFLEYQSSKVIQELNEKLDKSIDQAGFLKFRKGTIERRFNEIGREEVEAMLSGNRSWYWVKPDMYKKIIKKDSKKEALSLPGIIKDDGSVKVDTFVKCYLLYIELQAINDKLSSLNNASSNNDLISLIKEFVETFSKRTMYSPQAIQIYLEEWQRLDGHSQKRSKAKDSSCKRCSELEGANDGTLSNWEEKWEKFREARTG